MFNDIAVRKINFKSEMDLYDQIIKNLEVDINSPKVLTLKTINIIGENAAIITVEHDTSKLLVEFYCEATENKEPLFPENEEWETIIMGIDEIKIMRDAGYVSISDEFYDIKDIRFDIDTFGNRKVVVYIAPMKEKEDTDNQN